MIDIRIGNSFDLIKELKDNSIDCIVTCYDNKTEILTEEGWKNICDILYIDKVATLNRDNENIEYQNPYSITKQQYTGKMLYLNTPFINILVTPNHRMYISNYPEEDFYFVRADELPGSFKIKTNGKWTKEDINTINIKHNKDIEYPFCPCCGSDTDVRRYGRYSNKVKTHTKFRCLKCKKFFYSDILYQKGTRKIFHDDLLFNMDDFLEFFGYWVTEGHVYKNKTICLTQKNIFILSKMMDVCKRMKLNYRKYDSRKNGVYDIHIYCHTLADYLEKIGKCKDKYIPKDLLNLSQRQLFILYNSMMLGDGDKVEFRRYYTSSIKLANDFQEILLKIGYSGSIVCTNKKDKRCINRSIGYTIGIKKYKTTPQIGTTFGFGANKREWIDYDGYVYCVSVPNEVIYVRREGRPLWCGNSPPYYAKRFYGGPTVVFDETIVCEHEWDTEIPVSRHKKDETNPGIEGSYKQNEAEIPTAGCFCKKCKTAWQGRLGNEPTPEQFLSHLWQFFELAKPKLKKTGSVYVNIGDSYWGSMQGYGASKKSDSGFESVQNGFYCSSVMKPPMIKKHPILKPRSLCMIPQRFAWGMVEKSWILREDIVWAKGNIDDDMEYKGHFKPESVKNRLTSAHEYIYHFVLNEDYYYNLDAVKIPIAKSTFVRAQGNFTSIKADKEKSYMSNDAARKYSDKVLSGEVTTKNPGDVIFLSPKSYRGEHYAVYSQELIRIPILSSSPENGVILDPFGGSGSTGAFCRKNNRNAILFEINSDYRRQLENNTLSHTPELSKWL